MYLAVDMATAISLESTLPEFTYTPTSTTGNIFPNMLPPSSFEQLVLSIFESEEPSDGETYSEPDEYITEGVRLILRGDRTSPLNLYATAKKLYTWLKKKSNWEKYAEGTRRVFKVHPMGIGYMGEDKNGSPEYVIKFVIDLVVTT